MFLVLLEVEAEVDHVDGDVDEDEDASRKESHDHEEDRKALEDLVSRELQLSQQERSNYVSIKRTMHFSILA